MNRLGLRGSPDAVLAAFNAHKGRLSAHSVGQPLRRAKELYAAAREVQEPLYRVVVHVLALRFAEVTLAEDPCAGAPSRLTWADVAWLASRVPEGARLTKGGDACLDEAEFNLEGPPRMPEWMRPPVV